MEDKINLASSLGYIQDIRDHNIFHMENNWDSMIFIDDELHVYYIGIDPAE